MDIENHTRSKEDVAGQQQAFLDPEELYVGRDGSGNVIPVTVTAHGFGEVRVKPMVYGDTLRLQNAKGNMFELDPREVAFILHHQVIEPDILAPVRTQMSQQYEKESDGFYEWGFYEELSDAMLSGMKPFAVTSLLMAVFQASNLLGNAQMQKDGSVAVDLQEAVDPKKK